MATTCSSKRVHGCSCPQYLSLKAKRGKDKTRKLLIWHTTRKEKTKELSMYRLRQMDLDDKVCEQVSMTMLTGISPKEVIVRCAQQSQPWSTKKRRVRGSTVVALVLFVIGMALWSRLNQCQVWQKLVGQLSDLHPAEPESLLSDWGLSGRRKELGSACLQGLMRECCQLIAHPQTMKSAFFGRYRVMAVDGTVFNAADTEANGQAF